MFNKKSGHVDQDGDASQASEQHINPYAILSNKRQFKEESQNVRQQRYFNSPQIQELCKGVKDNTEVEGKIEPEAKIPKTESPAESASEMRETLKETEAEKHFNKKGKKGVKSPMTLRRRKLNQRLSKILTPKSAPILLHELKPGCAYKVQEQPGCIPSSFCAQVEHENRILGIGQGLSKSQAKNCAAENAIKTVVLRTMSRHSSEKVKREEACEDNEEDTPENLPWAGLASFAMYKMFSEWQSQGADLLPIMKPVSKEKVKTPNVSNVPTKKELPPNAAELHPAVVLNMVCPGMTAVELEREDAPKCRVKMGYSIDGKMYTGIGGNKKDAKKEAAKAVLQGLYGLSYD